MDALEGFLNLCLEWLMYTATRPLINKPEVDLRVPLDRMM